jgi:hypothetical protein
MFEEVAKRLSERTPVSLSGVKAGNGASSL